MKKGKTIIPIAIIALAGCIQSVWAFDAAAELAALKVKYPEVTNGCAAFESLHKVKECQHLNAMQDEAICLRVTSSLARSRQIFLLSVFSFLTNPPDYDIMGGGKGE